MRLHTVDIFQTLLCYSMSSPVNRAQASVWTFATPFLQLSGLLPVLPVLNRVLLLRSNPAKI